MSALAQALRLRGLRSGGLGVAVARRLLLAAPPRAPAHVRALSASSPPAVAATATTAVSFPPPPFPPPPSSPPLPPAPASAAAAAAATAAAAEAAEPATLLGLVRAVLRAGRSERAAKRASAKDAEALGELDAPTLRRLLDFARPEARTLGAAVATLGVSTAISLLFPFAIGQVLDVAIHPEGARAPGVIAAGLLGLFLVQSATIVVRGALLNVSGERMAAQMRKDLFKHILAQDMAWFDRHRTGDVITRLSNDTGVIQKALTSNVASGLRSAFMVAGGTGMLFYLSPYLALLSLSLIPPVAIAGMAYGTYVQGQQRAVQEAVGRTMEVAEELVGSVRTVRQFAREAPEAARFAARVEESFQLARRIGLVAALFDGAVHAAADASLVAVLWYGGDLVMAGSMSAGDLTAFLMYSLYTGVNIASLSGVYTELKRAAGAAQRVFAVADSLPSIPLAADADYWAAADNAVSRPGGVLASLSAAAPRAIDTPPPALRATGPGARAAADAAVGHAALRALPGLRGDVTFDRIDFRYPTRGESPVLRGLDLRVPAGRSLALVGGSGSGKSTVGALLTRLYDPQAGAVRLDGVDVRELDPAWLRSVVGVVSQEPALFAASIADNIRYGRSGAPAPLADVREAARLANADAFISSFPQGYDTLVGERGVQLSGGQRQRVAIARAILKNPPILVLDEATSALDSESEAAVQAALENVMRGRTTITIAHRLSTIRCCDLVALLQDGRVAESGTFEALFADENSLLRKLVDRQMH